METPTQNQPIPSPNATRWLYIILAIFALIIIGLSIWLISTKSNLRVLQEEKEQQRIALVHEVDSLIVAHNQTKAAYGALADSLMVKDSLIQANAVEIKKIAQYPVGILQDQEKTRKAANDFSGLCAPDGFPIYCKPGTYRRK